MSTASSPVPKRKSRSWIAFVVIAFAAAGIFLIIRNNRGQAPTNPFAFGGPPGRPTPVNATAATQGSLPIYMQGLGTVTSLNTTVIRSRVEGELLRVNFSGGQLVKEGDVLAEIDARPFEVSLQQAEGQLARDRASLANAKTNVERSERVRQFYTSQDIDGLKTTVAEMEASVMVSEAAVKNAKLQLSYTRITAPISGRTGLRQVDIGNLVRPSDSNGLVVITQENPISVVFTLPEDSVPAIAGSFAKGRKLRVEAYDRGMKNRLGLGELIEIDNLIDATTGSVRLKASFANENQTLFPNQFVNVRLLIETLENVVLIPNSAVQLSTRGRTIFVVKPDTTLERRVVTVGASEGGVTLISAGLQPGEMVVTEGLDRLREGSKVTLGSPTVPGAGAPPARGNAQRKGPAANPRT